MKLWEALKLLDEGKKVRRETWDKGDYLYKEDEVIKRIIGINFVLELDTLTYVDWEEHDDRKELPEQLQWMKSFYHLYKIGECSVSEKVDGCTKCPINEICLKIAVKSNELNKLYKLDK